MAYDRSYLAGQTDYTGVSLEDILEHLRDWERATSETIVALDRYIANAREHKTLLENPREVIGYASYCVDLFSRYLFDIRRLIKELPAGVTEAHVEIVKQLYESANHEDDTAVRFKNDWVYKSLPHEEMRPLLDDIYADTRNVFVDYRDFSNMVPRLRTFIGAGKAPTEVLTDFQLKPSFFGVGLNLNRMLARMPWLKKRK